MGPTSYVKSCANQFPEMTIRESQTATVRKTTGHHKIQQNQRAQATKGNKSWHWLSQVTKGNSLLFTTNKCSKLPSNPPANIQSKQSRVTKRKRRESASKGSEHVTKSHAKQAHPTTDTANQQCRPQGERTAETVSQCSGINTC